MSDEAGQSQPDGQRTPPENQRISPQEHMYLDFETLSASAITMAMSSKAALQLKGLRLLKALLLEADENAKTDMGKKGVIDLLSRILREGIAHDASPEAVVKIKEMLVSCIWSLCIGHVENKKKAHNSIDALISVLESVASSFTKELNQLAYYTGMGLWAICYGVIENKQKVMSLNGLMPAIKLLCDSNTSFDVKYATAGIIWHLSELPEACKVATENGVIPELVKLVDSADSPSSSLVPCLAIAALSKYEPAVEQLRSANGFKAIIKFTEANNPVTFTSPFVWTTLQPLIELLDSPFYEVKELGCFLSYTICARSDISKLFQEGVVDRLKVLAYDREHYNIARISRLTLTNLNVPIEEPRPTYDVKDTMSWLTSIGLQEFAGEFERHHITFDVVPLLTEQDLSKFHLPLGAQRKLLAAIDAIRRSELGLHLPPPRPDSSDKSCLVCMDAPREYCFVPCGHVVTCEKCAYIIRARNDPCIICRKAVRELVKPFYV